MTINKSGKDGSLSSTLTNTEVPPFPTDDLLKVLISPSLSPSILEVFQKISREYKHLHETSRKLLLELDMALIECRVYQQKYASLNSKINDNPRKCDCEVND